MNVAESIEWLYCWCIDAGTASGGAEIAEITMRAISVKVPKVLKGFSVTDGIWSIGGMNTERAECLSQSYGGFCLHILKCVCVCECVYLHSVLNGDKLRVKSPPLLLPSVLIAS